MYLEEHFAKVKCSYRTHRHLKWADGHNESSYASQQMMHNNGISIFMVPISGKLIIKFTL